MENVPAIWHLHILINQNYVGIYAERGRPLLLVFLSYLYSQKMLHVCAVQLICCYIGYMENILINIKLFLYSVQICSHVNIIH